MEPQVISKQRVADHGEVYTSPREVNAMLDLVKHETERIDSKFLEPACGTGNFLAEVLRRKLDVVECRYRRSPSDYQRNTVIAVSSLYGIDILEDNVIACRDRLFDIVDQRSDHFFRDDFFRTVRYILDRNIIWGDALSLTTVGDDPQPIVFSEWAMVNTTMTKRRDFTFTELLEHEAARTTAPLFSEVGEQVFLPQPLREYPLVHFLRVADVIDH